MKNQQSPGKKRLCCAYVVDSYHRKGQSIEEEHNRCDYIVCVFGSEMTTAKALEVLTKRDCIEKVSRVLKSWIRMDKISVHFESLVHGKSLVWFVGSVIRSAVFTVTDKLRVNEKKRCSVPALLRLFEEITLDKGIEIVSTRDDIS